MPALNVAITEGERQLILLALAKLSIERPGWDDALNQLALKMDNEAEGLEGVRAEMYDSFRRLDRNTAWHKILDHEGKTGHE